MPQIFINCAYTYPDGNVAPFGRVLLAGVLAAAAAAVGRGPRPLHPRRLCPRRGYLLLSSWPRVNLLHLLSPPRTVSGRQRGPLRSEDAGQHVGRGRGGRGRSDLSRHVVIAESAPGRAEARAGRGVEAVVLLDVAVKVDVVFGAKE